MFEVQFKSNVYRRKYKAPSTMDLVSIPENPDSVFIWMCRVLGFLSIWILWLLKNDGILALRIFFSRFCLLNDKWRNRRRMKIIIETMVLTLTKENDILPTVYWSCCATVLNIIVDFVFVLEKKEGKKYKNSILNNWLNCCAKLAHTERRIKWKMSPFWRQHRNSIRWHVVDHSIDMCAE